jgi:acrylyl-CoA reductase (NADPH)
MDAFNALRIHEVGGKISSSLDTITLQDLSAGEVLVRVRYSCINYKDALAATGAGRILRRYPLVGGIDLAGDVVTSSDPRYKPGDEVLVTGCGLSETHDGGYSEYARVHPDWVVPLPSALSLKDAMTVGTAGFTAALAIHRMEQNGQAPDQGPVVVTGATGGVGSLAIDMLATRGYDVVAVSGKPAADEYLRSLGASRVLRRQEIDLGKRPLESVHWAGGIDNLGGDVLAWLTRTTQFFGNIASIGLAASPEIHTSVMPFILRGVSLLGINSVANPRAQRLDVWKRIATDLKPRQLARICVDTVVLKQLTTQFPRYLAGAVQGRTVVRIEP